MAVTTTISVSIPIELSIELAGYLEEKRALLQILIMYGFPQHPNEFSKQVDF